MAVHYDDKGKVFTNVISKEAIPVIVQTLTHRLYGYLYVREGERIKDELARSDQFIAITNAVVYNANGDELYRSGFLALNREQIVWLIPADEMAEQPKSGGAE